MNLKSVRARAAVGRGLIALLAIVLQAFASSAALAQSLGGGADPGELAFGSVAMDIPAVMHQRLQPLTAYLSDQIGVPVTLRLSPDMPAAIDAAARGRVDLAYLTPVAYIKAHDEGGVQLVAKTVTEGRGAFRLMIVVADDSAIQDVGDLAGKRFAFGDQAALLQRAVVVGSGVSLEELGDYRFLGHYDNIVRAVISGDFEAGILKDTMAYKWEGRGVRILYASPELPPYNIVARANMLPDLVDRIRAAFLSLNIEKPDQNAVIKALDPRYTGFAPVTDGEYDVVRQLVAPFHGASDRNF